MMRKLRGALAALVLTAVSFGAFGHVETVAALPVATFTSSKASPIPIGVPVTFDASASTCGTPTCGYRWVLTWRSAGCCGATHVLAQMGTTKVIKWTFDMYAATRPTSPQGLVTVTLTVIESNSTHNSRSASKSFILTIP